MTREEKLEYCGNTCDMICSNHFYNDHNQLGVKECWFLHDAKIVTREIYPSSSSLQRVGARTLACFRPERKRDAKWLKDAGLGGKK